MKRIFINHVGLISRTIVGSTPTPITNRIIHCEELLPLSSEEEQMTVNHQVGISKFPVAANGNDYLEAA